VIYAVEMDSCGMIYLSSFMKFGIGVQAILKFHLRNLRGCELVLLMGGIYEVNP
jgi:hypothetical protein